VADVVALELEAGVRSRHSGQDVLDVLEGVLEHEVPAVLEMLALPVVLELLEAVQHRKEAEIHRAHVEGGDLGLELAAGRTRSSMVMPGAAAGGEVDHGRSRCLIGEEGLEGLGRLVGLPVSGLRACRWTMAAPASAAAMAASAISFGRHGQVATSRACGSHR
jgi:hypothetical protein